MLSRLFDPIVKIFSNKSKIIEIPEPINDLSKVLEEINTLKILVDNPTHLQNILTHFQSQFMELDNKFTVIMQQIKAIHCKKGIL